MDPADWATIGISLVALGLSWISFHRQHDLQKRLGAIEEARREEELTARLVADVTAQFESRPRRGTAVAEEHFLVLVNRGPARATDLEFESPDSEAMPRFMKEGMGFPIALDPGQRFPVLALLVYGGTASVPLMLRWSDGRGSQEKSMTLASP